MSAQHFTITIGGNASIDPIRLKGLVYGALMPKCEVAVLEETEVYTANLRAEVERLREVLRRISAAARQPGANKEWLGRVAEAALPAAKPAETKEKP